MYVQIHVTHVCADTRNTQKFQVHIHSLSQPDPGTLPVPRDVQSPGLIIPEPNQLVTPAAHGTQEHCHLVTF